MSGWVLSDFTLTSSGARTGLVIWNGNIQWCADGPLFALLDNIFRAITGGLHSPRAHLARWAVTSSARTLDVFYIRAGTAVPLRAAAPRPQTPEGFAA